MGSFSWMLADKDDNLVQEEKFKCLIPKEFGGGFVEDEYQDYGYLGTKEDGSPKYDMYELIAFWNGCDVSYKGEKPGMKEIDEFTDSNRNLGIYIGCYDNQIDELKYPLKLVSLSYTGTYEDCDGRSYGDPLQGFSHEDYDDYELGDDEDEDDEEYDDYQEEE